LCAPSEVGACSSWINDSVSVKTRIKEGSV
jgi:hypothetical protein